MDVTGGSELLVQRPSGERSATPARERRPAAGVDQPTNARPPVAATVGRTPSTRSTRRALTWPPPSSEANARPSGRSQVMYVAEPSTDTSGNAPLAASRRQEAQTPSPPTAMRTSEVVPRSQCQA